MSGHGRPRIRWLIVGTLTLAALAGCVGPATPRDGDQAERAPAALQRKSITIAIPVEIQALATDVASVGIGGPTNYFHAFVNEYLTVRDDYDAVRPQLSTELPSVESGTWRVLDDGRMDVTWRLRRGVLWHDGTEFTSRDVAFGWEAARGANSPLRGGGSVARFIEAVDTPDPHTAVVRWRQTSQFGGQMEKGQLDPLPSLLLESAFLSDPEGFFNHPYFTAPETFVGAGPYRPVTWERGSHIVVEAFDRYFLGRPKIDRITFRFIHDPRTALVNVLSGSVDIARGSLGIEEGALLRQDWARSGAGTVLLPPNTYRHLLPQLRPELVKPADILNPNVRKALVLALDRREIVEGSIPGGTPDLVADSIAVPGTPYGDGVASGLTRYPYDPARAAALLEDAGWRRDGDGILAKPNGERFQIELRIRRCLECESVYTLMQQHYRRVGIELGSVDLGASANPADYVLYPGLLVTGLPANQAVFGARWHSSNIARTENRFTGANYNGYTNLALDRVLDNLDRSIRLEDQLRYWAEAWRILTDDVGVISLYFYPQPNAVRKGLVGPIPANSFGSVTWQIHLWDIQ